MHEASLRRQCKSCQHSPTASSNGGFSACLTRDELLGLSVAIRRSVDWPGACESLAQAASVFATEPPNALCDLPFPTAGVNTSAA